MINNKFFLIGLLCLFNIAANAQKEKGFLLGRIVEQETGKPIPFATIRVVGKNLGVISNDDGGFKIPIQFKTVGEKVEISCMGYEKKEIPFSNLDGDELNIIKLKASIFELRETVLKAKRKRPPTPRKILKRAIEKIPVNYPQKAFSYVGYYRDYQQKENDYLNLNEAILKVFDSGFDKNDYIATQSQIYNYIRNDDFERDSIADGSYDYLTRNKIINNAKLSSFGGNEFYILRIHDAIRNYKTKTFSYVDVLEKDIIKNHKLARKKDVLLGDERMFVIGLKGSNSSVVHHGYTKSKIEGNIRAEGEIYISQSTYAIHKMVYRMFDLTLKDKNSKRITEQLDNTLLYEIAVEYKEYGGKMYPNYLSLYNAFKVKKIDFYVEEVVFDIAEKCLVLKTNNPPVFFLEFGKPNVILSYENKRIAVKDIQNRYEGIYVYPDDDSQIHEIMKKLELDVTHEKKITSDSFQFEFSNIMDEYGNVLNKFSYEDYGQYREFFTQQIITDAVVLPENGLLMKKNTPIFKKQSIARPDDYDKYWMNTPLKSKQ